MEHPKNCENSRNAAAITLCMSRRRLDEILALGNYFFEKHETFFDFMEFAKRREHEMRKEAFIWGMLFGIFVCGLFFTFILWLTD
jgi:hypothetical protein